MIMKIKKNKTLLKIEDALKDNRIQFVRDDLKNDIKDLLEYLKNTLINIFASDYDPKRMKFLQPSIIISFLKFYIGNNLIKKKELKRAIKCYAPDVKKEDIVAMIVTDTFFAGRKGLLFTKEKIYYKEHFSNNTWSILYADITDIRIVCEKFTNFRCLEIYSQKANCYRLIENDYIKILFFFFIENIIGSKNTIFKVQQQESASSP